MACLIPVETSVVRLPDTCRRPRAFARKNVKRKMKNIIRKVTEARLPDTCRMSCAGD